MKNFNDILISIFGGEITALGIGLYSLGKSKLVAIILYGSFIDFSVLCVKTGILAVIGGFGGLFAKEIWERIKARY